MHQQKVADTEIDSLHSSTSSFERAIEKADELMTKNRTTAYQVEALPYTFDEDSNNLGEAIETQKQVIQINEDEDFGHYTD